MVRGITRAAGPAAASVSAFVQIVFDDLAQEVTGLVVGFSRRGGGFRHPAILVALIYLMKGLLKRTSVLSDVSVSVRMKATISACSWAVIAIPPTGVLLSRAGPALMPEA